MNYMPQVYRRLCFGFLGFGLIVLAGMVVCFAEAKGATASELSAEDIEVASVRVDGVDLFRVRGLETYSAKRRAREIAERIIALAKNPQVKPESVVRSEDEDATDIVYGKERVLVVLEADGKLEGLDHATYARAIVRIIRDAITNYRDDRKSETIRRSVMRSSVATVILVFLSLLLFWGSRRLGHWLEHKRETAEEEFIKIRSMDLVEAERFWQGMNGLRQFVQLIITFVLLYFYLEYVLGFFPWTRGIATDLHKWVVNPLATMGHAIVDYIPELFFLLLFVLAFYVLLKLLRTIFIAVGRGTLKLRGFENEWAWPTYRIVRMVVIAFGLVIIYPYLPGSESAAFKGVSIFMGVLLSLGSSSAIANVIAGYSLIYRRAFRVGDRIRVGDVYGDVTRMRLLVTHVRTIKNEEVTVPNSVVLNSHVINYSALARTKGLILHTKVGIGYEVPWRQVEAMLLEAATRTDGLMEEPPPFILTKGLADFSIEYELNVYCEEVRQIGKIYTQLHQNILDVFNEHNVQIMTPAYMGDPQNPKVVPKEKWFTPPAQQDTKKPGN